MTFDDRLKICGKPFLERSSTSDGQSGAIFGMLVYPPVSPLSCSLAAMVRHVYAAGHSWTVLKQLTAGS
jgi:hypothetical protein